MAKHIMVEQGSLEWLQAKIGIPTASEIHKVISPGGRLSKQSKSYAHRLVAERLLRRPLGADLDHIDAIASGKQMEQEAVDFYELEQDLDTAKAGFFTTNDNRVGCSPDRLVRENGLLECKVPMPQTQIAYLLDSFGMDYHCQRQCQLWVTERSWLDMMSYSRELPPVIVRYERDEPFIRLLADALDQFSDRLDEMTQKAIALGAVVKPPRPAETLNGVGSPSLAEMQRLNEAAMRLHAP